MNNQWYRAMDIYSAVKSYEYVRGVRDTVLAHGDDGIVKDPVRDELGRMADAVCAVVEEHQPCGVGVLPVCRACGVEFPCPTRQAIAARVMPTNAVRVSGRPVATEGACGSTSVIPWWWSA